MYVMVPVGQISAELYDHPPVLCLARVVGTHDQLEPRVTRWWLDVWPDPGGPPLPQLYRAEEILGVPAYGFVPPAPAPAVLPADQTPPSPTQQAGSETPA